LLRRGEEGLERFSKVLSREGTEIVVRRERERELDTEMTAVFIETGVQTGDVETERDR
jgi:hypothetical protein